MLSEPPRDQLSSATPIVLTKGPGTERILGGAFPDPMFRA